VGGWNEKRNKYPTKKGEVVVGYAKPNKKHENLGGATKPVQKSFGWQLILAHTHEELKLNWGGGGTPFPKCIEHRPSPPPI
jgi:hypothetical protein